MTEKATTLRESMKSLGARTRGFALVFLASALGVLVTGVLAMFSVVHIALTGVCLGLTIVSLVIVRTLNLRKREIKARLRNLDARPAKTKSTAPITTASEARGSTASEVKAAESQAAESKATEVTAAESQAAESKPRETRSAGSTKAAQARAVMQRNAGTKRNKEEADTGEIPLVRIRNEAAEGHTTRQVLLTGPIPIVEEAAPEASAAHVAKTEPTATDSTKTDAVANATATESTRDVESASEGETVPRAETVTAQEDDVVAAASNVDTVKVNDPFMQRLQARGAWSPTPLPVPSYVEAPQVEHPVPESKAADASSYETQARSREDIAAQFAAELGYRPELSDSARDDSPLEHGRKAIRTSKAPEMGAVDDVLARRRA